MGSRLNSQHPLHQTLLEALDPFCTTDARERVFAVAAQTAQSETIPTDVFEFCDYVRGPLRVAITQILDEDVTEHVLQHLAPILMTASSSIPAAPNCDPELAVVVQQAGPVRNYVLSVLANAGFEAISCEDAMQANAVIAKRRPALLLVESELSGMMATQLATMVRRAYGDQAPAFVMVPSEGDFEPADLLSAIDHSLSGTNSET